MSPMHHGKRMLSMAIHLKQFREWISTIRLFGRNIMFKRLTVTEQLKNECAKNAELLSKQQES